MLTREALRKHTDDGRPPHLRSRQRRLQDAIAKQSNTGTVFTCMRIIEDQEAKAICDGLGIDWESQPDVTDVAKKRPKGGRPWRVPGSLSPAQIWLGDAGTPGTSFEDRVERRVIRSRGSDGVAYTFQEFLDWCDNDFDRTLCLWNWAEPARDLTQTKMHT